MPSKQKIDRPRSGPDPVRLPAVERPDEFWAFQLYEELELDSGTGAEATQGVWDVDEGQYVFPDAPMIIVKDVRQCGYHGLPGARGAFRWRKIAVAPGWIGEIVDMRRGQSNLRWAFCKYDYDENGGDPRVECNPCKRDGSEIDNDTTFWVHAPRQRDAANDLDPSIYKGDVICYSFDDEGTRICQSPNIYWSQVGEFRFFSHYNRPLKGWHEADGTLIGDVSVPDAQGQVLMARDPDGWEDERIPGQGGGFRWHGPHHNNHLLHTIVIADLAHTHEGTPINFFDKIGFFTASTGNGTTATAGPYGDCCDPPCTHVHFIDLEVDQAWDADYPSGPPIVTGSPQTLALDHYGESGPNSDNTDNAMAFLTEVLYWRYK